MVFRTNFLKPAPSTAENDEGTLGVLATYLRLLDVSFNKMITTTSLFFREYLKWLQEAKNER